MLEGKRVGGDSVSCCYECEKTRKGCGAGVVFAECGDAMIELVFVKCTNMRENLHVGGLLHGPSCPVAIAGTVVEL
jgi:hypothetical protein